MTADERQIALFTMEHLRDSITTAKTKDGRPIMTATDLHQYLTEQINHIRGNSHLKPNAPAQPSADNAITEP